jgi:uncharacterized membrane protein
METSLARTIIVPRADAVVTRRQHRRRTLPEKGQSPREKMMLDTYNLTQLGAVHTAISLLAVLAGVVALFRYGRITTATQAGLWFVLLTAATCITGLFIFRHGGFGPPHGLSVITLLLLAVTWVVERKAANWKPAAYIVVLGNSLALFFHLLPALNEGGTRWPLGNPAFTGPTDPKLQAWLAAGFAAYVVGAGIQALRIRREQRAGDFSAALRQPRVKQRPA